MEFINKHKRLFISASVVMCIIMAILTYMFREQPTFVENMLGYVITPLQKAGTIASGWVADKINFLTSFSDVEVENKRLKAELEQLRAEKDRLSLIELENIKLSELLEIDRKYAAYEKTGAMIIAKDMGNWYRRFTIDKGANHGIEKNMVVLASGGLVGTIIECGSASSKVISLIDNTSSISAKTIRTDDIGFVKGDLDLMELGYCRMEHIDINADIMEGDEIVTSQLSDIYPPGIIIGRVKEIKIDSNGLTKYAIIQPEVDFKHLETVLVINKYKRNSD